MSAAFFIIATLIVAGAIAAMTLQRLIHCALALAVSLAGVAMMYLHLKAQFVGFAQILVYIGAVAILIVFAILLTSRDETVESRRFGSSWFVGVGISTIVFGLIGYAVLSSEVIRSRVVRPGPDVTVRQIGDQLMTQYVLALEVIGLLLTVALLGAVILARRSGAEGEAE